MREQSQAHQTCQQPQSRITKYKQIGRRMYRIYITYKVNPKQKQYLQLIYKDLANRSKSKKLTHSVFTNFFQLTGLWGDKLFKYFDVNNEKEITLDQFLTGIAKMVRNPFNQKVKTLFNFIKEVGDQGIRYKQFLKMLYHYSKPQLKQIMTNDGVFVHQAIIPSSTEMKKTKQSEVIHLKHEPSIQKIELGQTQSQNKNQNHFEKAYNKIYKDYQDPGTSLQFKTQKITYQVSYCNMSTLTKQYASHIFRKYNINKDKQYMKQSQFADYIQGNMKLFDTYYAVFHENLWGYDNVKKQPFFIKHIQKQSSIFLVDLNSTGNGNNKIRQPAYLMLLSSALIISVDKNKKQSIIKYITLQGIATTEMQQNGMVIKDQPEGNSSTYIQFNTPQQAKQWYQELKPYSNNYFQNKYQILQSIGTGKFSVVYRCRQRSTNKQYALKVLQLQKLEPKQQASIQNQTQIIKILKSPNFIKIHETIKTKKSIYIISEYVYGQDLYQYIKKKKRLPQSQAAFILGQIIEAVIHLHSLDIIHRDLKPENIMKIERPNLEEQQSPFKITKPKPQMIKLIDFGFANYYSVLQQLHQQIPVGTLNYMAPQILLGQKPTFQNDTFAIGSIFYFMLRGKYPFDSPNPKQAALLTIRGDYSLHDVVWDEVSDQAKQLIELLLKTEPNQRITLKQALEHPWFKELNNYNYNQA